MLNRLAFLFVALPVAGVLIAFSVANRARVPLTFDPFNPGNPALTVSAPLFLLLLLALMMGVLLGGMATWINQGKHRRRERLWRQEAARVRESAEDLRRRAMEEANPLDTTPVGAMLPAGRRIPGQGARAARPALALLPGRGV